MQLALLEERRLNRIPDTLLFVEHPAVITFGRKTPGVREKEASLPTVVQGVPVHLVERGGEATLHAPGQLVVYPIIELSLRFGPKAFLRLMEESMIAALATYGVRAYWLEGKTGVWLLDSQIQERKIASLGIAVRRSVSYHGLAINLNTDLRLFSLIQPCGFTPSVMTNLREQIGREVAMTEFAERLESQLRQRLALALPSFTEKSA